MLEMNPIFPTPTWRYPVPEMRQHHGTIKAELEKLWGQGYFQKHGSGYGYQTREELFTPRNIENIPWVALLKERFVTVCSEILASRHGHSKRLPFEIYSIQGWILIQTNESWVEGPWHNHHPATLSGCYYLQVPQTRDPTEGLLMFQRPEPTNIFGENMAAVRPLEGHLTIFPSYLMHRPTPTPTAREWRINICMDAFVHWHKRFEDPLTPLGSGEDYDAALARSRRRP